MARIEPTAEVRCPACNEPITLTVRLRYQDGGPARVHINTDPVRDHIDQHTARPDDTTGAPARPVVNISEPTRRPTPFECAPGNRCHRCAVCWR